MAKMTTCSACGTNLLRPGACPHCGRTGRPGRASTVAAGLLGLTLAAGALEGCELSQPLYGTAITDKSYDTAGDTGADTGTEITTTNR
ncbi:MAG: hypothetical protein R3F59_35805 [Myxococcota bacterium]